MWILISILVLILILLLIFIFIRKKKKHKPDYYNLFIIGIVWSIFGLIYKENSFFFIMGLAFIVIGLVHKKDWKKNHRTWKQLSKEERKWKMWLIIGLFILVILTFVALLLTKGG